jgi:hypothetical protein
MASALRKKINASTKLRTTARPRINPIIELSSVCYGSRAHSPNNADSPSKKYRD